VRPDGIHQELVLQLGFAVAVDTAIHLARACHLLEVDGFLVGTTTAFCVYKFLVLRWFGYCVEAHPIYCLLPSHSAPPVRFHRQLPLAYETILIVRDGLGLTLIVSSNPQEPPTFGQNVSMPNANALIREYTNCLNVSVSSLCARLRGSGNC